MRASEIRDLSTEELERREEELKEELFNLKFQRLTGQLENTGRLKQVRREIARVKTILREKGIKE